ncbi:hypothetical protein GCM10028857_14220 [Salinarchaeum chitinilyticum]
MPSEPTPPDLTIACHVRPALILDPIDAKVATLRTAEHENRIDSLLLRSWPGDVALVEDTPHPEVLEQYERFERWADAAGVSLAPAFQTRETTSLASDRTVERLVTPSICLACYDGDQLVGVFPHTDDETTHTVPEVIAALRTGSLPGPLRPTAVAETPESSTASDGGWRASTNRTVEEPTANQGSKDRCPDCGGRPINVQGLLNCPDCEWYVGIERPLAV